MESKQVTDLNTRIAGCTACSLHEGRTQTVPGDGNPDAELLFVGEAPGFHEDRQGRPFVGRAGRLLDQLLADIGLSRADVFVVNMVKCRPPNNRDPEPLETETCRPFLEEQIGGIRPKVIVTVGRIATQAFLPGTKISQVHGKAERAGGLLIFPVYHPAAALRKGSLLQVLREDFQRIPELLASYERPTSDSLISTTEVNTNTAQLPLL